MNKPKRKSLGRGLDALLGEVEHSPTESNKGLNKLVLPIEKLQPGTFQPRQNWDEQAIESLADSILAKGILQPLLVRQHPNISDQFEIIAGERRWRAAQRAKLHEVPVIIREMTDIEALEIGLIENLQRQDLSAIEEAEGYRRLIDEFEHTQEKLAKNIGKSRTHVTNTLRLLSLPESIRGMINSGELSAGHARTLVGKEDAVMLAKKIVKENLSVRASELLVKNLEKRAEKKAGRFHKKDADTRALEQTLCEMLGLKVVIHGSQTGGSLEIQYKTLDQLDDVLRRLSQREKSVE